jgi:hypothetical protein
VMSGSLSSGVNGMIRSQDQKTKARLAAVKDTYFIAQNLNA